MNDLLTLNDLLERTITELDRKPDDLSHENTDVTPASVAYASTLAYAAPSIPYLGISSQLDSALTPAAIPVAMG